MQKFSAWISLLLLITFFSCDFNPNGEYIVPLSPPDPSGISIELTQLTSDTLYLFARTEVFYKALAGNKPIKQIRATIGTESFGGTPSMQGSFFIETSQLSDGFHKMELEIVTSSGTGSLAEIREQETFRISRNYVVAVDKSRPDPVKITSIHKVDGTLEVVWEKYGKFNFEKYYLTKYYLYPGSGQYAIHWIKEINDKTVTSLRDSTYIGGKIKYTLSVIAGPQQSVPDEKYFEYPFDLSLTSEWADKTHIKFTWRKTPFYKNLTSYTVSFTGGIDTRSFIIEQANDTTLTVDAQMTYAESKTISLVVYPVRPVTYHYDFIYTHTTFYHGSLFPTLFEYQPTYHPTLNKYFATSGNSNPVYFFRINASTNMVEDTILTNSKEFAVSDNGQYLYLSEKNILTRYDPLDFSVKQTFDLSTRTDINNYQDWRISISNTNKLAISDYGRSYVIDMNTFTVIQQWLHPGSGDNRITISPNGNYMIRQGKIYAWNGTQFIENGSTYNKNNISRYIFKNDEKLILGRGGMIDVIELATGTLEREITTKAYDITYDPVSNLMSGRDSNNRIYIYSLDSSQPLTSFVVKGNIVLQNNQLIAGHGFILPLSFYYP